MTMMLPVPVPVRIIVVVILARVVRIIASVFGIRVAISGSYRYAKVTVSLGSLGHESDEPKHYQKQGKTFFMSLTPNAPT
jgi:hypothetical protein